MTYICKAPKDALNEPCYYKNSKNTSIGQINDTYCETIDLESTSVSPASSGLLLAPSANASRFGEEPKAGGGWMLTYRTELSTS